MRPAREDRRRTAPAPIPADTTTASALRASSTSRRRARAAPRIDARAGGRCCPWTRPSLPSRILLEELVQRVELLRPELMVLVEPARRDLERTRGQPAE